MYLLDSRVLNRTFFPLESCLSAQYLKHQSLRDKISCFSCSEDNTLDVSPYDASFCRGIVHIAYIVINDIHLTLLKKKKNGMTSMFFPT